MDTLRGNFADRADFDDAEGYDPAEDDAGRDMLPPGIGRDERRMQVRAYNHWASLIGERNFPAIDDLEPDNLPDFGPYSVLLDFTEGVEDPGVSYLGDELAMACDAHGVGLTRLSDVPTRSLLSRITDHYMQILANQTPIGFEAEFVNRTGATLLYRGILLPFSSDDDTIDFIFGVINWKELADQQSTDELMLEIDQALDDQDYDESDADGDADGDAAGWSAIEDEAADSYAHGGDAAAEAAPVEATDDMGDDSMSMEPVLELDTPIQEPLTGFDEAPLEAPFEAPVEAPAAFSSILAPKGGAVSDITAGAGYVMPGDEPGDVDLPTPSFGRMQPVEFVPPAEEIELDDAPETGTENLPHEELELEGYAEIPPETPPETPAETLAAFDAEDRAGYAEHEIESEAQYEAQYEAPYEAEYQAPGAAQVTIDVPYSPQEPHDGSMALGDWLASARELAQAARSSEDRTRGALYDAIGRAYDFSLAAAQSPDEFVELLENSGLTMQDRAPMTPVVKLVFGADYDKTRLTEYASALSHAHRIGLQHGALGDYLREAEGGLKAVVAAERRLRREEQGIVAEPADGPRERLAKKLRRITPMEFEAIPPVGKEFALMMIRRSEDGEILVLGEVPDDVALIERAARKLLG